MHMRLPSLLLFGAILMAPAVALADWYTGGTMHRATLGDWRTADPLDRLATAADWSVRILGEDRVRQVGMAGIRPYAEQLVACVDEVALEEGAAHFSAAEIAAACSTLLGQ
jgi:hypothetical protein